MLNTLTIQYKRNIYHTRITVSLKLKAKNNGIAMAIYWFVHVGETPTMSRPWRASFRAGPEPHTPKLEGAGKIAEKLEKCGVDPTCRHDTTNMMFCDMAVRGLSYWNGLRESLFMRGLCEVINDQRRGTDPWLFDYLR